MAAIGLIIWVILCTAGVLIRLSPIVMIVLAAAGLLAWDWLLERAKSKPGSGSQAETGHWRAVLAAVAGGTVLAILGTSLNLRLPFIIVVLFVLAAFAGVDRLVVFLKKS